MADCPAIEMIAVEDDGFCLLADGTILPVTSWLDEDGDDCSPDDAVACVAGTEAFGWLSIDLCEAFDGTVH